MERPVTAYERVRTLQRDIAGRPSDDSINLEAILEWVKASRGHERKPGKRHSYGPGLNKLERRLDRKIIEAHGELNYDELAKLLREMLQHLESRGERPGK